jgi:hypothetical protein
MRRRRIMAPRRFGVRPIHGLGHSTEDRRSCRWNPQCGPDGPVAANFKTPEAYYGMHAGLDSLRAVLGKHAMRAIFVASVALGRGYPAVLRSPAGDGHEVAAHGPCTRRQPARPRYRAGAAAAKCDLSADTIG